MTVTEAEQAALSAFRPHDVQTCDTLADHDAGLRYGRAEWKKHGKAAGPIRNQRMLDEGKPDRVVAFPGGRGTADMVRRARTASLTVIEVKP